jgi:hypothetical protein
MANTWDLSNKKWLYWTGVVGFIIGFQIYLWLIAVIIYFAADKDKPKTQNYQIERIYEKYMIIVGNVLLAIAILVIPLNIMGYISLF